MKALIDCRASTSLLSALKGHGFEPILMPPADYLQKGVASHPDMLLFIGFDKLFCYRSYYANNKELIDGLIDHTGFELSISDEKTEKEYPFDVLFNACLIGKRLICNGDTVSRLILDSAIENNYDIINVPQGYTKCSICVVSENAIITADRAIANACISAGIDVLTISSGNISLPPYDYGFIGGSSGTYQNTVYFSGSAEKHPDSNAIFKFCQSHGKQICSLSDESLLDVGTIFFI